MGRGGTPSGGVGPGGSSTVAAKRRSGAKIGSDGNELRDYNGKAVRTNPDGTITLYHNGTPANIAQVRATGRFHSGMVSQGNVYLTNRAHGWNPAGTTQVSLRVPSHLVSIDDAFPSGEVHFSAPISSITPGMIRR